jgi:hypothetical protein
MQLRKELRRWAYLARKSGKGQVVVEEEEELAAGIAAP